MVDLEQTLFNLAMDGIPSLAVTAVILSLLKMEVMLYGSETVKKEQQLVIRKSQSTELAMILRISLS